MKFFTPAPGRSLARALARAGMIAAIYVVLSSFASPRP